MDRLSELIVLTAALALLSVGTNAAVSPDRFYVSTRGNDKWSGRLAKPNAKATDGPFATLARAQQAVRKMKTRGLKRPMDVVVQLGTYYLKSPLLFTPQDSGTETCPITYRAAAGASVVLSGGERIVRKGSKEGGLWQVDLPEARNGRWTFRLLRVGDKWATRARYPNADPHEPIEGGWLFAQPEEVAAPHATKRGETGFIRFAEGSIPNWKDVDGAEVHVFPAWGWVNAVIPVQSLDRENRKLVFKTPASQDIRAGNRFFIENVREALDQPGEWYLDTHQGRVYCIPTAQTFGPVVAPRLDRLVVLQGDTKSGRYVEYLRFEGFTFTDTDYTLTRNYYVPADAAVWMSGARNVSVHNCEFRWLGGYALRLDDDSNRVEFTGNRVHDVGQGGVVMLGDTKTHPHHNLIADNTMRRLGLIYKHVAGVYVTTGSDNRIAHNTISDVPRYGISLKTYEPGAVSHNNVVEYNDIRRTNLETNDTGAIETLGRDRENSGNVIRYNLILDSIGVATTADGKWLTPHMSWGIYLDDYSSGTTVYGNVVARTDLGGICVHGGKDNVFENNIFVNGRQHQVRLQPRDDVMKGNRFLHNIIAYSRPESALIYSWDSRRDRFSQWDYNLYYLKGADLNSLTVKNTPEGTFAQWLQAGYDSHSLVADPMFINPGADDYRLRSESPAFKLGFKMIPLEKIGARRR